jgi:prepilin-type processing-associated H-X9-DG protein
MRYLWYTDDDHIRRPAPLHAALAPYLGQQNLRLDSTANMVADLENSIVTRLFHCPADEAFAPGVMIGSFSAGWFGPPLPSSYAFNEGILGFEANNPHRLRGNLAKARPPTEIVFMGDGLPRGGNPAFIAWYPTGAGKSTLWNAYTHTPGTEGESRAGLPSEFDSSRHPRFRMNIVFCDGHVESLVMNQYDLPRGVLLAK